MTNDLIDRHAYAATRHLSVKTRRDVAKELDSLIGDMLAARGGEGAAAQEDVEAVLTELGDRS
jgi:hypothetical protein